MKPISRFDHRDNRLAKFASLVEENKWHGLSFQHASLCDTRAWLHLHRISYAHLDNYIKLGTIAHENTQARDNSVNGLFGIMPDQINWNNKIVIEAKGTGGAKDAVGHQTSFYAAMLTYHTQSDWGARNTILSTRKTRDVPLGPEALTDLLVICEKLVTLTRQIHPPKPEQKVLCAKCSNRFLCWKGNI